MRKTKIDQRKLFDQANQMVDMAKVCSQFLFSTENQVRSRSLSVETRKDEKVLSYQTNFSRRNELKSDLGNEMYSMYCRFIQSNCLELEYATQMIGFEKLKTEIYRIENDEFLHNIGKQLN